MPLESKTFGVRYLMSEIASTNNDDVEDYVDVDVDVDVCRCARLRTRRMNFAHPPPLLAGDREFPKYHHRRRHDRHDHHHPCPCCQYMMMFLQPRRSFLIPRVS